jgi:hypothetical protein
VFGAHAGTCGATLADTADDEKGADDDNNNT